MQTKTARLFSNGGSQAVRLPAEFRFDGREVFIRRDARTGDIILSRSSPEATWADYLAKRGSVSSEFMAERPLNERLPEPKLK
jgi:antitoxin VapB